MGLVRLMQAGSAQYLASALRQVLGSSSLPDQAPARFTEAVAGSSAWPASEAHVAAAKQLDSCLEDLQARSLHSDTLALACNLCGPLSCMPCSGRRSLHPQLLKVSIIVL